MARSRIDHREVYEGSDCLVPELFHLGWTRLRSACEAGLSAHSHRGWELCWLRRGTVDWWAGKQAFTVPQGNCYLTQPHEAHGAVHAVLEPCDLYWLQLRLPRGSHHLPGLDAAASRLVLTCFRSPANRMFPGDPGLHGIWSTLLSECRNPGPLSATVVRATLHCLYVHVVRLATAHGSQQSRVSAPIRAAQTHALGGLDRGVAVSELAAVAKLSPSRFHARFVAEVSETPADWLRRRRLDRAKQLLATTTHEVTALALSLGFPSSQYFATVFRRYTGLTPREYRTQARAAPT
jgi:AraC family transcriptional regulator, L-rhamnose operon regulatory protein RhaS